MRLAIAVALSIRGGRALCFFVRFHEARLELAKHMIDTLGVLEEKTKGNLSSEEAQMLTSTLHQLRMAYLSIQQDAAAAAGEATEPSQSQIELP